MLGITIHRIIKYVTFPLHCFASALYYSQCTNSNCYIIHRIIKDLASIFYSMTRIGVCSVV